MSQYKTIKGPHGSTRYMKDGKLISAKNIPEDVLQTLTHTPEINEEQPVAQRDKSCVFCGQYSNLTRLVDMQSVALCEQHYYSESLGRVAQKVRSIDEGSQQTETINQET